MNRRTLRALPILVLSLLWQNAAIAADDVMLEVPAEALNAMDVDKAMDIVTMKLGYYWLRTLRWNCPYVTSAGERRSNNYGVKLQNLVGVGLGSIDAGPGYGTIYFVYQRNPNSFCRIPYEASSRQEAMDVAVAFTKLAAEPQDVLRAKIKARYPLNIETATSAERFLTTEVSLDIARTLLQEHMRSQVKAGGAGQFIAEPSTPPVGSEFTVATNFLAEPFGRDASNRTQYRLLSNISGRYEGQKETGSGIRVCRDSSFYRAIYQEGAGDCDEGSANEKSSFVVNDGQISYLPANINTTSYHESEIDGTITVAGGSGGVLRRIYIRACYAESTETITLPAGPFDTVKFICGSVRSDSRDHDKEFGSVWVDQRTGLVVKSEMQVNREYSSQRYQKNDEIVSLNKPQ